MPDRHDDVLTALDQLAAGVEDTAVTELRAAEMHMIGRALRDSVIPAIVIFAVGQLVVYVGYRYGDLSHREVKSWEQLAVAFAVLLGLLVGLFRELNRSLDAIFPDLLVASTVERRRATRDQRVDKLVRLLREANSTIADLEQDIISGNELAAQVEERVRQQQQLAEITTEQTAVVADLVREELREELLAQELVGRWRQIWIQVAIAGVFMALGLLLGHWVG